MPTRRERQATRRQTAEAFVLAGVLALIGTPVVYRIRAASAHARASRNAFWPTGWMVLPLLVAIIGLVVAMLPPSFDLRRALLRRRAARRRR